MVFVVFHYYHFFFHIQTKKPYIYDSVCEKMRLLDRQIYLPTSKFRFLFRGFLALHYRKYMSDKSYYYDKLNWI